jgi:hypothetical protein
MTNDFNPADWPAPSGQPTYRPHGEHGAPSSRSRRLAVGVGLLSAAGLAAVVTSSLLGDDAAAGADDRGGAVQVEQEGRDHERGEHGDPDRSGGAQGAMPQGNANSTSASS